LRKGATVSHCGTGRRDRKSHVFTRLYRPTKRCVSGRTRPNHSCPVTSVTTPKSVIITVVSAVELLLMSVISNDVLASELNTSKVTVHTGGVFVLDTDPNTTLPTLIIGQRSSGGGGEVCHALALTHGRSTADSIVSATLAIQHPP